VLPDDNRSVTDTDALVADMRVADVLVAGAGPAGRALAAELAVRGLSILLVDPHPDRPWQATHTGWLDELVTAPGFDPVRSVRATLPATFVRDRRGELTALGRTYVVLDPAGAPAVLRARADAGACGVTERTGRVGDVRRLGDRLAVAVDGQEHSVRLLVDATGAGGTLGPGGVKPASTASTWQWASGRIGVLESRTRPVDAPLAPGSALIMDWSGGLPLPGEAAGIPRSFGYALDLGDGRHLVEETVLAGPRVKGVLRALSARLDQRLDRLGLDLRPGHTAEQVAIPLDCPVRGAHGGVLPVGVAAGTIHPASGYSVTGALRTAPAVAAAIAGTLSSGASPDRIAAAGAAALWTPRARLARRMLLRGMRTTGRLAPDPLADFFATFFALGADTAGPGAWSPYLAQPPDPAGVAAVMTRMFGALPGPDRARLAGRWLLPARGRDRTRRVS
jgi:lycopene beta-cyclase